MTLALSELDVRVYPTGDDIRLSRHHDLLQFCRKERWREDLVHRRHPFETVVEWISFGELMSDHKVMQTVTRGLTDDGAERYYFGGHFHGDQDGLTPGDQALIGRFLGPLLVGNDPLDRERIWQQLWAAKLPENVCSVIDLALWDLAGRVAGLPGLGYEIQWDYIDDQRLPDVDIEPLAPLHPR
jgi:hypothetical protein